MHYLHNLNFINARLVQNFKIIASSKINLCHNVLPQKDGGNQFPKLRESFLDFPVEGKEKMKEESVQSLISREY